MITLITGIPGSGKTSWLVAWLMQQTGRPIFVDGIPELKLPHEPCPPLPEWTHERPDPSSASGKKLCFSFPPNSVICIDEAQRVYRPRPVGSKVPPEVAAFETHRHEGLDFFLLTQNPTLIDANVRKLVGRHIHFRATWAGRYMHEWNECADVESSTARNLAATTRYKLPKEAFGQYKSAELHTKHKARIPMVAYVFAGALVALAGAAWHLYGRFQQIAAPASPTVPGKASQGQGGPVSTGGITRLTTAAEYVEHYRPRIAELPHTAPAYDEVTKPADAPVPVGCIDSKRTGCLCYDQQGTHYHTSQEMCRQIMANNGLWIPWKKPEAEKPKADPRPASPMIEAPVRVSIHNDFGGSHNPAGGLSPSPTSPAKSEPIYTLVPKG